MWSPPPDDRDERWMVGYLWRRGAVMQMCMCECEVWSVKWGDGAEFVTSQNVHAVLSLCVAAIMIDEDHDTTLRNDSEGLSTCVVELAQMSVFFFIFLFVVFASATWREKMFQIE